jgi:Asp-tRNA(Asn)/Glu-tRNA(Gln) amidotransferase A subunit family amidase
MNGPDAALLETLSSARDWGRFGTYPSEARPRPAHDVAAPGAPLPPPDPAAPPRLVSEGGVYVHIEPAEAVEEARRRGAALPLGGMTLAVKDCIAQAGLPIVAGSQSRAEAPIETEDAEIVGILRDAGAAVVGSVTQHELASGVTGVNVWAGTPANPVAPGCAPGGSSSGSAVAVAEGSARVALGTDTGGSSRIPAAFCAVAGFKPAYGSYPWGGVMPVAPTLDHLGLLARELADIVLTHRVITGDPVERSMPESVGISAAQLESADPVIARRIETLLGDLEARGCRVREVGWPTGEDVFIVGTTIFFSEAAAVHGGTAVDRPETLGDDIRLRLLTGNAIPAVDYVGAMRHRRELQARVTAILAEVDCVLGPTVPIPPPTLDAAGIALTPRLVENTRLADITGTPAVSLVLPGRPPAGLQLTAATDARTLGHALAIDPILRDSDGA